MKGLNVLLTSKQNLFHLMRAISAGTDPGSLAVRRLKDGHLDLRGMRIPRPRTTAESSVQVEGYELGKVEERVGKTLLERIHLERVDLSNCDIRESTWREFGFREVRFNGAKAMDAVFASGNADRISMVGADLRNTHWGTSGSLGPVIYEADFRKSDLRGSSYGHPVFRHCRFADANLKDVDFHGSGFEECTFEGSLEGVWFHGWYDDVSEEVRKARNAMRNVDFSEAELRFCSFTDGIDLTSCVFPEEGYLKVCRPMSACQEALELVRSEWSGKEREKAEYYLKAMLKDHFREEQPFTVFRIADFYEPPWNRLLGDRFVEILRKVSKA